MYFKTWFFTQTCRRTVSYNSRSAAPLDSCFTVRRNQTRVTFGYKTKFAFMKGAKTSEPYWPEFCRRFFSSMLRRRSMGARPSLFVCLARPKAKA